MATIRPHPQPIYAAPYPQRPPHNTAAGPQSPASPYTLDALSALASTASSQYDELDAARDELDRWAHEGVASPAALSESESALIGAFTPFTFNNHNAWEAAPPPRHLPPMQNPHHHHPYYAEASSSSSSQRGYLPYYPPPAHDPNHALRRYPSSLDSTGSQQGLDEQDLKRLRNTAASARFRAKKKQREQSLERSAREKREKLAALEDRIAELEAENQWLKNLIMEKHDAAEDIAALRKRYNAVAEEMKGYERDKDGLGT